MNSIDLLLVTPELKLGSVKQRSPKLYHLLSSTGSSSPFNRAKGAGQPGPLTLPALPRGLPTLRAGTGWPACCGNPAYPSWSMKSDSKCLPRWEFLLNQFPQPPKTLLPWEEEDQRINVSYSKPPPPSGLHLVGDGMAPRVSLDGELRVWSTEALPCGQWRRRL